MDSWNWASLYFASILLTNVLFLAEEINDKWKAEWYPILTGLYEMQLKLQICGEGLNKEHMHISMVLDMSFISQDKTRFYYLAVRCVTQRLQGG